MSAGFNLAQILAAQPRHKPRVAMQGNYPLVCSHLGREPFVDLTPVEREKEPPAK